MERRKNIYIPIWELTNSHTSVWCAQGCSKVNRHRNTAPNRHQATRIYYIKNVILWFRHCVRLFYTLAHYPHYGYSLFGFRRSHAYTQIMLNAFRLPNISSIRWLTTMISLPVAMNGIRLCSFWLSDVDNVGYMRYWNISICRYAILCEA